MNYVFEKFIRPKRNGWGAISSMKIGEIKIFDEPYFKLSAKLRANLKKYPERSYSIANASNGTFAIRRDL